MLYMVYFNLYIFEKNIVFLKNKIFNYIFTLFIEVCVSVKSFYRFFKILIKKINKNFTKFII